MKRIYSSSDSAELGLIASHLTSLGISCEVRSESQVFPGLALGPELWILNDEDYEEASNLVSNWVHPETSAQPEQNESEAGPVEGAGDTRSLDSTLAALYRTISGPAGVEREWTRFRDLFHPDAKLMRTVANADGTVSLSVMTVEEFVDFASPYFRSKAFYEREIFRKVDQFGYITQVFSTFDSSSDPVGTDSLGRGINSIQLWTDGTRWWVLNLLWDNERPGVVVPPMYSPQ